MIGSFQHLPARLQSQIGTPPYDVWKTTAGMVTAQFYRRDAGFLVRFPGLADFEIDDEIYAVRCALVPNIAGIVAETLLNNSIRPILANHAGGLNLHGSASAIDGAAVAFLGVSRRGKTTMAGAFARAGYPFLTEDVVDLEPVDGGYLIRPSHAQLRLFHDSASFLLGQEPGWTEEDGKNPLSAGEALPHGERPMPLTHLFLLGPGDSDGLLLQRLSPAAAMAELIQHSFVLDVEDRRRLGAHFQRIGALAERVSCYNLDYPRSYDQLADVMQGIVRQVQTDRCECEID